MKTKYKNCAHLKPARTNEYTEGAEAIMEHHGLSLTISFLKTDYYFDDDKEPRNMFRWTLSNGNKRIWGNFGDSIADTENNERPTAYDILSCITKYDPGNFENFCSEFGYDSDSIRANKTYKAVKAEWEKISRICTEETLEALQTIN